MKKHLPSIARVTFIITILSVIGWGISKWVNTQASTDQTNIFLFVAVGTGIMTALASFKDILELFDRWRGPDQAPSTPKSSKTKFVVKGRNAHITYIARHYNSQAPRSRAVNDLREQVAHYLEWMAERYGKIELRGIKRDGQQVVQLDLDTVYVPLEAETALDPRTITSPHPSPADLLHGGA